MIQLRLDNARLSKHCRVSLPGERMATVARVLLSLAARPLRHLLQSGAAKGAHRLDTQSSLSGSLSQQRLFERWFVQYQVPLLDYLYGMTRDRDWAADLVQDTFLHAYSAARRDSTAIEHPQAWLYRIATNTALSALRRKRRFSWLPLSVIEQEASTSGSDLGRQPEIAEAHSQDVAVTVAERDAVWTVLVELPARWRAVLLLQTTGGFEVREIAALLGISEANSRKILFRAKERFRQIHARLEQAEEKGEPR
jgi:RNA polymerase sigma-70 factor (ECF subfamily)